MNYNDFLTKGLMSFADITYKQCVFLKDRKINLEIIDISTRPVSIIYRLDKEMKPKFYIDLMILSKNRQSWVNKPKTSTLIGEKRL